MTQKLILSIAILICPLVHAENIDPYNSGSQYVYSENAGWLNFKPTQGPGVHVYSSYIEGYVWSENIGWINLAPEEFGGIENDGYGNLAGYAWGENVGWINFNPQVPGDLTDYGVWIDAEGNFNGYAWGENIGWIKFDSTKPYNTRVCIVGLEDLHNFVSAWLTTTPEANLNNIGTVNILDFQIFASHWLDYCPNNWGLK